MAQKFLFGSIWNVAFAILLSIFLLVPSVQPEALAQQGDADDSIVVPDSIRATASSITVVGTPGPAQLALKLMAKIQRLAIDTHGRIAKGNLDFDLFMQMPLGLRYVTAPGKYYIGYSHNYVIVDLAPGEEKVIELKSLTVPKSDRPTKFKVFTDLSVAEQQDREILFFWVVPNILTFNVRVDDGGGHIYKWDEKISQTDLCRKARMMPTGKKYCSALLGSDYKAMTPFYKFGSNGEAAAYSTDYQLSGLEERSYRQKSESWQKIDRIMVADGNDGDTVALIPGTYIIETTDSQGRVSTQSHVEVK